MPVSVYAGFTYRPRKVTEFEAQTIQSHDYAAVVYPLFKGRNPMTASQAKPLARTRLLDGKDDARIHPP